jgi:hypothetical protein
MGVAGYVSVCVQLYCMLLSAVFNEGKQHRKNTNRNVQSATTWGEKKKQKGSEAESFKHMKIKYHTHLTMAM